MTKGDLTMSRVELVVWIDDLTGEELPKGHTVVEQEITLDGTTFVLDLGPSSMERFRAAVAPYVDKAPRRYGAGKVTARPVQRHAPRPTKPDRLQVQAMREWWRNNWEQTNPPLPPAHANGRIPQAVCDAYDRAGGRNLRHGGVVTA